MSSARNSWTRPLVIDEHGCAERYARELLAGLGFDASPLKLPARHPAQAWAASGLMWLTGSREPLMCPAPLAACADGALAALAALAPENTFADLSGAQLLAERAAIAGHQRQGPISPGGSCRLLKTADGWLALNLARDDDWDLLPAWLEQDVAADWAALEPALRKHRTADLITRGRELGLALSNGAGEGIAPLQFQLPPSRPQRGDRPRVIELASLWAGPLCGHLLQLCGAEVIKIESAARPDGARRGPPAFFDLLNGGKHSVALDLRSEAGREQLRQLIRSADIVIEGSRPRALRQLGINAETLITDNPQLTWLSLTGHGRAEPQAQWIAYGDDAAVAAGLTQLQHQASGERVMVGDAIADPFTGLHAALAGWAGWRRGGGGLLSLPLSAVVAQCIKFETPAGTEALRERQRRWTQTAGPARPPQARAATRPAPALGADNAILPGT